MNNRQVTNEINFELYQQWVDRFKGIPKTIVPHPFKKKEISSFKQFQIIFTMILERFLSNKNLNPKIFEEFLLNVRSDEINSYTSLYSHIILFRSSLNNQSELHNLLSFFCKLPFLREEVLNERDVKDQFNNSIEAARFESELALQILTHAPVTVLAEINLKIIAYLKQHKTRLLIRDAEIANELVHYKLVDTKIETSALEIMIRLLERPLNIPQNISECASLHLIFFNYNHFYDPDVDEKSVETRYQIHRRARPAELFDEKIRGREQVLYSSRTQEFGITEAKYLDDKFQKWHRLPLTPHKYRAKANLESVLVKNFKSNNIPYIAGPSGTTADVLEGLYFLYPNMANEQKLSYMNLLAAGEIAQGHHSWFEVMIVFSHFQNIKFNFLYNKFLSSEFKQNKNYQLLLRRYPQYLHNNRDILEDYLANENIQYSEYINGVMFLEWEGTIVSLNNPNIFINEQMTKRIVSIAYEYNIAIHIISTNTKPGYRENILNQLNKIHSSSKWESHIHVLPALEGVNQSQDMISRLKNSYMLRILNCYYPHLNKQACILVDNNQDTIKNSIVPAMLVESDGSHFQKIYKIIKIMTAPVKFARGWKINSAYNRLKSSKIWESENLFKDEKRLSFNSFRQLSNSNVADLKKELGELTPLEKEFYKGMLQQNYHFTHYTNARDEILDTGHILSNAALVKLNISFQNSSSDDDKSLGNGGFVFFRSEISHFIDKKSRFGSDQFTFPAESFKYSWVSLTEMLGPVPKNPVDNKGEGVRYTRYIDGECYLDGKLLFWYGKTPGEINLINTIFTSADMYRGIALSAIRELRRISSVNASYQQTMLVSKNYNKIISDLFQVEGKVPQQVNLTNIPYRIHAPEVLQNMFATPDSTHLKRLIPIMDFSFNQNTKSLAHLAAINGNKVLLEFCFDKGISPSAVDEQGRSILFYVIGYGHIELANYLMTTKSLQCPEDVELTTLAIQNRSLACLQICYAKHPSLIARLNQEGNSALHEAVLAEKEDIIVFLMSKIDLNIRNKKGETVLLTAISNYKSVAASIILKLAPELIYEKDSLGEYPIMIAIKCDNMNVFFKLLQDEKSTSLLTSAQKDEVYAAVYRYYGPRYFSEITFNALPVVLKRNLSFYILSTALQKNDIQKINLLFKSINPNQTYDVIISLSAELIETLMKLLISPLLNNIDVVRNIHVLVSLSKKLKNPEKFSSFIATYYSVILDKLIFKQELHQAIKSNLLSLDNFKSDEGIKFLLSIGISLPDADSEIHSGRKRKYPEDIKSDLPSDSGHSKIKGSAAAAAASDWKKDEAPASASASGVKSETLQPQAKRQKATGPNLDDVQLITQASVVNFNKQISSNDVITNNRYVQKWLSDPANVPASKKASSFNPPLPFPFVMDFGARKP